MSAPTELKLLRSIKTGKGLVRLITNLKLIRRKNKVKGAKRLALTGQQRKLVFEKTDGHCHICGLTLELTNFQADHVESHSAGGAHKENNYLPSCFTCNNYRWHYSSEEMQIILKLGVWAKAKVMNDPALGLDIANQFVKHEMTLRKSKAKK